MSNSVSKSRGEESFLLPVLTAAKDGGIVNETVASNETAIKGEFERDFFHLILLRERQREEEKENVPKLPERSVLFPVHKEGTTIVRTQISV